MPAPFCMDTAVQIWHLRVDLSDEYCMLGHHYTRMVSHTITSGTPPGLRRPTIVAGVHSGSVILYALTSGHVAAVGCCCHVHTATVYGFCIVMCTTLHGPHTHTHTCGAHTHTHGASIHTYIHTYIRAWHACWQLAMCMCMPPPPCFSLLPVPALFSLFECLSRGGGWC
jgi:hypothetical protein